MGRAPLVPLTDLDNRDERLACHSLLMERELGSVEAIPLPAGYRYVTYRLGEGPDWVAIERSAGELADERQGRLAWSAHFAGRERELEGRMTFLETDAGEKVGTANAWHDASPGRHPGLDPDAAWLHWVAIRREHQGRGLAKPLVAHVLRLMEDYGYRHAYVPTQTTTWLAARLYLDLGFRPTAFSLERSPVGWSIMRRLTDHPALADVRPATDAELWQASRSERG